MLASGKAPGPTFHHAHSGAACGQAGGSKAQIVDPTTVRLEVHAGRHPRAKPLASVFHCAFLRMCKANCSKGVKGCTSRCARPGAACMSRQCMLRSPLAAQSTKYVCAQHAARPTRAYSFRCPLHHAHLGAACCEAVHTRIKAAHLVEVQHDVRQCRPWCSMASGSAHLGYHHHPLQLTFGHICQAHCSNPQESPVNNTHLGTVQHADRLATDLPST